MKNVLEVNDVSKSFNEYSSEFQRIFSWFGLKFKPIKQHQILKQINFFIAPGESVGIVGKNGAGKSTLLKIITGTLKKSSGEVHINGRVAAILELGMGFNPELTGRQNVYHSASLLGYPADKVNLAIDDIASFAEIGDYFDQPVRVYSSGMQARVAFSVATAFRPDILIVDEALSVGDVYFQSKCFARMNEMKAKGTSILLVSHDTQAIRTFCTRALLIDGGKIISCGKPKVVMQKYESMLDGFMEPPKDLDEKATSNDAKLLDFKLFDEDGNETKSIICSNKLFVRVSYSVNKELLDPHVGIRIADRFGNSVFETNTFCMKKKLKQLSKKDLLVVEFQFVMNLGIGDYTFDVALVNEGHNQKLFNEHISLDHHVGAVKVVENTEDIIFAGYLNMNPEFRMCE